MATDATNQAYVIDSLFAEGETTQGTGAEGTTTTTEPEYVKLTQAQVDEIIRDRQGKAAKEVRAENARLKAELDAFRATQTTTTSVEDHTDGNLNDEAKKTAEFKKISEQRARDAELAKQQAKEAEKKAEAAEKRAIETEKRYSLTNAASKQDFVDVSDVIDLTSKYVVWNADEAKFVVVNDDGSPRYNLAYQPMTPDEFYADYATKKPHLVKSGARGGAGSTTATRSSFANGSKYELDKLFGPKSDAGLVNRLSRENPAEYKRLRTQAVEAGLLRK